MSEEFTHEQLCLFLSDEFCDTDYRCLILKKYLNNDSQTPGRMNKCYFMYFPLPSVGEILDLRNIFGVYSTHYFCFVVSVVVRLSLLHGNLCFLF